MIAVRRFLLAAVPWLALASMWFWQGWHLVAHTLGLPCPW